MLISVLSFLVLLFVTFFGVIMRYFFVNPLIWQEEVQRWMIIWIVSFGASAAFRTGNHIAIEILVELFPIKVQRFIHHIVYIVVVWTLGYIMIHSFNYAIQLAQFKRVTDVLKIPYQYIYIVLPISIILMILNFTYITFQELYKKNIEEEAEYGN